MIEVLQASAPLDAIAEKLHLFGHREQLGCSSY